MRSQLPHMSVQQWTASTLHDPHMHLLLLLLLLHNWLPLHAHHLSSSSLLALLPLRVPREKYSELITKERELHAFMDAFPQRRAAKVAELAATSDAVNATLQRASRVIASSMVHRGASGGKAQVHYVRHPTCTTTC